MTVYSGTLSGNSSGSTTYSVFLGGAGVFFTVGATASVNFLITSQEDQAYEEEVQRHHHHLQLPVQDSVQWIHGYPYLRTIRAAVSFLDMQQMLEVWCDSSTFAIATWRGDAQRYWLTQVLEPARSRHDQWLPSAPAQRAILEPAYILGDRKDIPEATNAVESVLRTELLEVIPKPLADMATVQLSSLFGIC